MPEPTPAVVVRDLVMRYGDKVAVNGLDLTVDTGTITAVLGPNGAGKTTTIETCEGYRRPHAGSVRVLGLDPVRDRRDLLPRIGVMLQAGGAWSGARAMEMLRHMATLHADPLPVDELAARLGLDSCGRTPYRRLSGGQQARLGLAMAIVGRPELVFVDEPTAGMDVQGRHETWAILRDLRASGVTVVLTTHYLEEAEALADHVHIIDRGRLVASGSPADLTRAGEHASISLVVTSPFPESAPASLQHALGPTATVSRIDARSVVIDGPADPGTLSVVARWCADHDVVPQRLEMGRRNLQDVFLELTGREMHR